MFCWWENAIFYLFYVEIYDSTNAYLAMICIIFDEETARVQEPLRCTLSGSRALMVAQVAQTHGNKVTGYWEFARFTTSPFSTNFDTSHAIKIVATI